MTEKRVLHCWMWRREAIIEAHGIESIAYAETYDDDWRDGTCLLEAGHAGPHEFTDDGDITINFAPEARS